MDGFLNADGYISFKAFHCVNVNSKFSEKLKPHTERHAAFIRGFSIMTCEPSVIQSV